eukprot:TRINITY_DN956_c0_g1_i1.p1 TRINITY_DN956_c0_g1~~TRINITY_DN956_c0_g1_i1.p1  ORF type:complete len:795 (-),score=231.69 TRINITY_DN956_c0_g1_i1:366-2750(-)
MTRSSRLGLAGLFGCGVALLLGAFNQLTFTPNSNLPTITSFGSSSKQVEPRRLPSTDVKANMELELGVARKRAEYAERESQQHSTSQILLWGLGAGLALALAMQPSPAAAQAPSFSSQSSLKTRELQAKKKAAEASYEAAEKARKNLEKELQDQKNSLGQEEQKQLQGLEQQLKSLEQDSAKKKKDLQDAKKNIDEQEKGLEQDTQKKIQEMEETKKKIDEQAQKKKQEMEEAKKKIDEQEKAEQKLVEQDMQNKKKEMEEAKRKVEEQQKKGAEQQKAMQMQLQEKTKTADAEKQRAKALQEEIDKEEKRFSEVTMLAGMVAAAAVVVGGVIAGQNQQEEAEKEAEELRAKSKEVEAKKESGGQLEGKTAKAEAKVDSKPTEKEPKGKVEKKEEKPKEKVEKKEEKPKEKNNTSDGEREFSTGDRVVVLAPPAMAGKPGDIVGPAPGDAFAIRFDSGSIFNVQARYLKREKAPSAADSNTSASPSSAGAFAAASGAADEDLEFQPGQRVLVLGPPAMAGKQGSIVRPASSESFAVRFDSGSVFNIETKNIQDAEAASGSKEAPTASSSSSPNASSATSDVADAELKFLPGQRVVILSPPAMSGKFGVVVGPSSANTFTINLESGGEKDIKTEDLKDAPALSASSSSGDEGLEFEPGQRVVVLGPPAMAGKQGSIVGPVLGDAFAVRFDSGSVFNIATENIQDAVAAASSPILGVVEAPTRNPSSSAESSKSEATADDELEFSPGQRVVVLGPPAMAGKGGSIVGPVPGDSFAVRFDSGSVFNIQTQNIKDAAA